MARRSGHTSFNSAADDLLDKYEMRPGSERLFVAVADERKFESVHDVDVFRRVAETLEEKGAVELRRLPQSGKNGPLEKIKLLDAGLLYQHLGRVPLETQVNDGIAAFLSADQDIPADLKHVFQAAAAAWSLRRSWCGIAVNDIEALANIIRLVDGIRRSIQGNGMDMRTFSRRACGDSKALERNLGNVLRVMDALGLCYEDASEAEGSFKLMGIEKFPQPVLLAGQVKIDGVLVGQSLPYVGIPGADIGRIDINHLQNETRAVLTIENFASFHLQATEVPDPSVFVIYTGGFPSRSVAGFLTLLGQHLPSSVRFLHWGDIDMAGARIADFVWRRVDRPMQLHLMDIDLAKSRGVVSEPEPRPGLALCSPAHDLVSYLSGRDGSVFSLEQEEIDPCSVFGLVPS